MSAFGAIKTPRTKHADDDVDGRRRVIKLRRQLRLQRRRRLLPTVIHSSYIYSSIYTYSYSYVVVVVVAPCPRSPSTDATTTTMGGKERQQQQQQHGYLPISLLSIHSHSRRASSPATDNVMYHTTPIPVIAPHTMPYHTIPYTTTTKVPQVASIHSLYHGLLRHKPVFRFEAEP